MRPECAIRPVTPADHPSIREINRQAFRMAEPGTFERLLEVRSDVLGFVAQADGRIVGHVIFAPASVVTVTREVNGMGLGELAVAPEFQRRGIGTRLGDAGLAALRAAGCPFCIVVGHASYYPRFGFEPGAARGLACQWPKVPAASFMVAILDEERMRGVSGTVRFRDVD